MALTNTEIAKRLFEHGPLTRAEFYEITGWETNRAKRTLEHLLSTRTLAAKHKWVQNRKTRGHFKVRQFFLANQPELE